MTNPLPSLSRFPPMPENKFPPLVLQKWQPHIYTQQEIEKIGSAYIARISESARQEMNIPPNLHDRARPLNAATVDSATLLCIGYCFFSIVAIASIVSRTELATKYKVAIALAGGAAIPLLSIVSPTLSGCAFMIVLALGFLCKDPPSSYQSHIDNAPLPRLDPPIPLSQPNEDELLQERQRRWEEIYQENLCRLLLPRPVVPVDAAYSQDPRAVAG